MDDDDSGSPSVTIFVGHVRSEFDLGASGSSTRRGRSQQKTRYREEVHRPILGSGGGQDKTRLENALNKIKCTTF